MATPNANVVATPNANVGGAAVLKVGSAQDEAGGVLWGSVEVDACIPHNIVRPSLCEARATYSHSTLQMYE